MRNLAALVVSCFVIFVWQHAKAAEITLSAPESVPAGSNFAVTFVGTNEIGDQIGILVPGSGAYTRNGYAYAGQSAGTVELTAPLSAGSYEIVYRRRAEVIARTEIQVTDVAASLNGPVSVAAGGTFEVIWSGPAYTRDLIRILNADGTRVANFADVRISNLSDSRLILTAPQIPGDYTLGYVTGDKTLASLSFNVTAAEESMSAL